MVPRPLGSLLVIQCDSGTYHGEIVVFILLESEMNTQTEKCGLLLVNCLWYLVVTLVLSLF